jgi:hypothetical protein
MHGAGAGSVSGQLFPQTSFAATAPRTLAQPRSRQEPAKPKSILTGAGSLRLPQCAHIFDSSERFFTRASCLKRRSRSSSWVKDQGHLLTKARIFDQVNFTHAAHTIGTLAISGRRL